jgi:hypothetical protein
MKLFAGWLILPAVAAIAATGAQAQVPAPYELYPPGIAVSGSSGPYAALPSGPAEDYGPRLLPATEVYAVLRESGFSPLGVPQQRGFVYAIAVIAPDGDDGRLVIDARDGHILRFMPATSKRDNRDDLSATYGPVGLPPRIIEARGGPPRPPASIPRRYASRSPSSVPMPRLAPHAVVPSRHAAARPKPAAAPAPQSAAVQSQPADVKPVAVAPAPVGAGPSVSIEPTQALPPVQGLD